MSTFQALCTLNYDDAGPVEPSQEAEQCIQDQHPEQVKAQPTPEETPAQGFDLGNLGLS